MLKSVYFGFAAAILAVATGQAMAEQVVIQADRTLQVTVSSPPSTVIVGNPFIADATVSGNQVFINGYSSGSTNVIMLDENGANIATLDVVVKHGTEHTSKVFKQGRQFTYNCVEETCDPYSISGDQQSWFDLTTGQYSLRRGNARGETGPTAIDPKGAAAPPAQ